ncbi:hypothetical protein FACS1894132_12910 [Clostridia bacterium]|nr:hypothetical protein FACS1894132_12910 [Clostridia bacterium]
MQAVKTKPTPSPTQNSKRVTNEQIEFARSVNLAEYVSKQGYELEKAGKEIHVKGFGGAYVNPQTNEWNWFSSGVGGHDTISFVKNFENNTFVNAVKKICDEYGYMPSKSPTERQSSQQRTQPNFTPKAPTVFEKPEQAVNQNGNPDNRRVFAFMTQTRKIPQEIVAEFIKSGDLYQDKKGNAVFIHKDKNGVAVGAEIQGTATKDRNGNAIDRFKGVAKGTHTTAYKLKLTPTPKTFYVFESSIDLMSFYARVKYGKNPECFEKQQANLISMNGLKPNILEKYKEAYPNARFISCVDNDVAGKNFNVTNGFDKDQTAIYLEKTLAQAQVKDWNELAQKDFAVRNNLEFTCTYETPFDKEDFIAVADSDNFRSDEKDTDIEVGEDKNADSEDEVEELEEEYLSYA